MKLTNMANPARRTEVYPASPSDQPRYPYGLSLSLDTDALAKLGLTGDLPTVGGTLKLTALVEVTSVSERETAGGEKTCDVQLQITDMGLTEAGSRASADTLYKKA